jgi:hypothetical protein
MTKKNTEKKSHQMKSCTALEKSNQTYKNSEKSTWIIKIMKEVGRTLNDDLEKNEKNHFKWWQIQWNNASNFKTERNSLKYLVILSDMYNTINKKLTLITAIAK